MKLGFFKRAALFAVTLAALLSTPAIASHIVDAIAATVDGHVITSSEVEKLVRAKEGDLHSPAHRQMALNSLIDRYLLEAEAEKRGIVVSDARVGEAVATVTKRLSLTVEQLKEELTKRGERWEDYLKEIRYQILLQDLIQSLLKSEYSSTEVAVREFFIRHRDAYTKGKWVKLNHLTISGNERDAATEKIMELISKGASFPSAALDVIGEAPVDTGNMMFDDLAPMVADAVGSLSSGEISAPVPLGETIHLFEVIEQGGGSTTYEEVADTVRLDFERDGVQEVLKEWLEARKDDASIELR
ncbi:MAG: hypothetical protein C0609_04120 [Deltaproteobacteria bacterium]|nr:MAG: hypothetical protein C0609_04120 [Deltaproteobacteria bacterium]